MRKEKSREDMKKSDIDNTILNSMLRGKGYKERRKAHRLNIMVKACYKVLGKDKSAKDAITKDISTAGCLLVVSEKLPLDAKLEIETPLDENKTKFIKIKGRVVRLHASLKGCYEYGVAFGDLDNASRELFIDSCLKKIRERMEL